MRVSALTVVLPTDPVLQLPSSLSADRQFYYQGASCAIRALEGADILQLYPQPTVAAALAAYRPSYQPHEHPLHDWVQRLQWLAQLDPPVEREALVLHRSSNTPLGFLALSAVDLPNAKAEMSVAFFRGQGSRPALEAVHWLLDMAFIHLPFYKLVFCVHPDNHAAIQFLQGLGIAREAILRKELRTADGQRTDLWRYALLQPEWLSSPARARLQRLVPLQPFPATET